MFGRGPIGTGHTCHPTLTVDNVPGLFISFGAGLLLGVAGPAVHVVVGQGRSLTELGLTRNRLAETLMLAVLLAAVQAAITLPSSSFGAPSEWHPLLVMALVVGLFTAVFFRAYVMAILEPMIGIIPAVAVSAALHALYHVGYGMTGGEMVFLFGLGIVYAVAYALARSILVLWPLPTPVGGFFATTKAGDITLPLVAILGFADVSGLMLLALFLVTRWQRHHPRPRPAKEADRLFLISAPKSPMGSACVEAPTYRADRQPHADAPDEERQSHSPVAIAAGQAALTSYMEYGGA
jgi:uncharacterized protein